MMKIEVHCHSGYRVDETPKHICFGSRLVAVQQIKDRWIGPDHRYFKITGDDEATYIIRQDRVSKAWELIYYRQASRAGDEHEKKMA